MEKDSKRERGRKGEREGEKDKERGREGGGRRLLSALLWVTVA